MPDDPSLTSAYMKALAATAEICPEVYSILGNHGAFNWVIKELIQEDTDRQIFALTFLCLICSQGKGSRINAEELRKLDQDLIDYIIDLAVKEMQNMDDSLLTAAVKALFCINLQFDPQDNLLLKCLSQKPEAAELGNAFLVILNRGDQFSLQPCLELLRDIVQDPSTADFFFLNDLRILVDLIIREVLNLPVGSQIRVKYLEVLYGIYKHHPSFAKDGYRVPEITEMLTYILDTYTQGDPTYTIAETIILNVPAFG